MPPSRGPYKVQQPALTQEQLAEVDSLFKVYRKQLQCFACHNIITFHRHGSSSRDPTQPQFVCTSCKKYTPSHTMYHMLKVVVSGAQPKDMELAPNDPATTSTGDTPNLT